MEKRTSKKIPGAVLFVLGLVTGVWSSMIVNRMGPQACEDELIQGIWAGGSLMFISLAINWSDYVKK